MLACAVLAFGCSGEIGFAGGLDQAGGAFDSPSANDNAPALPTSPVPVTSTDRCRSTGSLNEAMRRLTPLEYAYTIEDVFEIKTEAAQRLVAEPGKTGFDTDASSYTTSQLHVERFLELATSISEGVPLTSLISNCDVAADARACVREMVTTLGRRLLRRTPSQETVGDYLGFFDGLAPELTSEQKVRLVVQAILMSPDFLYRPKFSDANDSDKQWEAASRLSYAIWGSAPDQTLLNKAEQGQLDDPNVLAAEATRLLRDGKARRRMRDFFAQLLEVERLASIEKDPSLAPNFADVRADMTREIELLIEHAMWRSSGTLAELLTADYTFTSRELAKTAGLAVPSEDWQRVSLSGSKRAGLLTTAGFMAVTGNMKRSSPVKRGQFVREMLLCQSVPPPPDDVDLTIPELDPSMTNREQFAELTNNESCANCHAFMNPIGFAFEHFDAAGSLRETQNGKAIDATGELAMTDVDGTFGDAPALVGMLSESKMVQSCFVQTWFRYIAGRLEREEDSCVVGELQSLFSEEGGLVPALMARLATTHAYAALMEEN